MKHSCLLCGQKYETSEETGLCQWVHIIKKDKYIKKFIDAPITCLRCGTSKKDAGNGKECRYYFIRHKWKA